MKKTETSVKQNAGNLRQAFFNATDFCREQSRSAVIPNCFRKTAWTFRACAAAVLFLFGRLARVQWIAAGLRGRFARVKFLAAELHGRFVRVKFLAAGLHGRFARVKFLSAELYEHFARVLCRPQASL